MHIFRPEPELAFRLALGTFVRDYVNKVKVVQLDLETRQYRGLKERKRDVCVYVYKDMKFTIILVCICMYMYIFVYRYL